MAFDARPKLCVRYLPFACQEIVWRKFQEHLRKQGIPSPSGRTVWSRDVLNKLINIYKYAFGIIDHATYFAVEEMKSSRCRNPNRNVEDDEEWNEQVNLSYYGPMR